MFSLPIAKVATIFINLLINLYLIKDIISQSFTRVLFNISKQIVLPLILMGTLLYLMHSFWNIETGKNVMLFLNIVAMGVVSVILPMALYYYLNPYTRVYMLKVLGKMRKQ
jgi:hypothetical protein